ncbi:Site-specific recombinase XerD [Mucilaginibacter gossypiicola]|uniref:Site-specific recombinase XerD n=1 Tax=Mucilaginibacter gossypiicola TaxID=551995 RepID=A0A1H8AB59_9SPHI|nr:site-specific integrase [Mucilaginibacter gossypiicola]SEM66787.1 Site-specific recombinase XerD [Mucilaginibacter gossypiicola]
MTTKEFKQSISTKVVLHHRVLSDDTRGLFLRVIIDRVKREFNLKESWPEAFFDPAAERVTKRSARDTDADRVNMILTEAKSRANRIIMRYFSAEKPLTTSLFTREFENYDNRENFLAYWKQTQDNWENEGVIKDTTAKNHTTSYNRLVEFLGGNEVLLLGDINFDFVVKFNTWMRTKKVPALSHNSACTTHTRFRTYIIKAKDDGFDIQNPYERYKFKYEDGHRESLEKHELQALKKLFDSGELDELCQETLRKFLFSCYTGIRISDTHQLHRNMIKNGRLKMSLLKGAVRYGKEINMLIPDYALKLVEGRKGVLFKEIADPTCNEKLKLIQEKANITKNLTFHVSRDTFGTLFIEMGGDVATLKELMGHSDIATTMIYVKMSEKRKDVLMANFNNL